MRRVGLGTPKGRVATFRKVSIAQMGQTLPHDSGMDADAAPARMSGTQSGWRFATKFVVCLAVAVLLGGAWWLGRTASMIERQSRVDEAQAADVIIVLGAAEYRGRPSPVYEARLRHALFLYLKGMAPRILTTGGAGGDPQFTEGEVGRTYLSSRGVPPENVLVEWEGESTVASVAAAGEIMLRHDMRKCIVVSDGYHIFRVKRLLEARGLTVFGSPRPSRAESEGAGRKWLYIRQAVGYGLWRLGIAI